jgi:hypothetical protein
MGTRTRGFIDYRHSDEVDHAPDAMLRILEATTPACQAVEDYWREVDPDYEPGIFRTWGVKDREDNARLLHTWWFAGPGHMSILFYPNVAEIFAGARWRGFLTIPRLREVHRAAFLSIARAVGATGILFVPDYAEELAEAADEGKGFEECLQLIEEKWGPMQGDLDEIPPAVMADCDSCPPAVWFLELT